jgi:hypothetical protein
VRRLRAKTRRQRLTAEPCIGSDNNGLDMKYVNVDPAGHFDSSTATLTVPSGARVVRAYLYWRADLARGVQNDASAGAPGPTWWDAWSYGPQNSLMAALTGRQSRGRHRTPVMHDRPSAEVARAAATSPV